MRRFVLGMGLLCALLGTPAQSAETSAAGKGDFSSLGMEELVTGNATIPSITLAYQIRYNLSTLMGEPVRNFSLKWRLIGFRYLPKGSAPARSDGVFVKASEARERLGPAVDKLELALHGLAWVKSGAPNSPLYGHPSVIEFDTGAATRPESVSLNAAGSPGWDRLLLEEDASCDGNFSVLSGVKNRGESNYLPAERAAAALKAGAYVLEKKTICAKGSGITNLDSLVAAITKFCSGRKSADLLCPACDAAAVADVLDGGKGGRKGPADLADLLDESADKPQVERKIAVERERYRQESERTCDATMRRIEACLNDGGCEPALPAGISPAQCDAIPRRPVYLSRIILNCDSRCGKAEEERAGRQYDAEMADWKARYGELARACQPYLDRRSSIAACRRDKALSCNPDQFTQREDCVARRMAAFAPSDREIREALKNERLEKTRGGNAKATGNFLD